MTATGVLAKSGNNAAKQRNRKESNKQSDSGKSSTIIECSNWSTSRGYNNRRTNGGKGSLMRSSSACGFGRVEWRLPYMDKPIWPTTGTPGPGAIRVLSDCVSNPAVQETYRWLRKKLFGTWAIKPFDARIINLNDRIPRSCRDQAVLLTFL